CAATEAHRRHRHAVPRRVAQQDLRHRRGDRESDGRHRHGERRSDPHGPLARPQAVLRRQLAEPGGGDRRQRRAQEHRALHEEREFVNIMMSPDGKLLYFFADDVLIYDTTEFKQVDKWELSRPVEEGLARFDFGPRDTTYEEPGFYTGIFQMQDPVQNRRIMGVARVNLNAKSLDFWPLGPARPVGFSLAPDRKRAYGLLQEIGHYEFWTFDLEHHKLGAKAEFAGRPRMALRTSSNGKMLYIYQAGNTIDLYEASTYKYLRTITLDADMTTELIVMPEQVRGATSSQE